MALINFSGIASGIDTAALIDALIERKRAARVDPLEKQVTTLQDTNSAYSKLTDLLSELQNVASRFRILSGGGISKIVSSSDETVASAVASNSASNGTHSITVSQLAENATQSFDDTFSDPNAAVNSGIIGTS